jgi:putative membrane protein
LIGSAWARMTTSALVAFIHHVAAFTLAGALIAELALFEANLNSRQARKIQRVDLTYGISAGVLLAAGLLRVFYFEKGGEYYFHNLFFIAKLSFFIIVALLSIYPTVLFVSWNKQLKAGELPQLVAAQAHRVRALLLLELLGIVGILLCAALMA